MHDRAAEFVERARANYDIDPDVHEFDDGTETAADAAAAIGCDVAQIASSLAFDVDGDLVVAVTSGANRVSEAALAEQFDVEPAAVEMAAPERIRERLGWSIGGVPPICHDADVPVVMDETLVSHDEVWAAAGTPQTVFPIDPERLRELAGAEPVAFVE